MSTPIHIRHPFTKQVLAGLQVGDVVEISGTIYTARDAAHKRIIDAINEGLEIPFPLENQVIYYAGPSPARPGSVIGSCGPTTSGRMDVYTPLLLDMGLAATIGKGPRSKEVIDAIKRNGAVYFAAVGGAAALGAKSISKAETIAYEDLGPEAVRKLEFTNYPCIVAIDSKGESIYT